MSPAAVELSQKPHVQGSDHSKEEGQVVSGLGPWQGCGAGPTATEAAHSPGRPALTSHWLRSPVSCRRDQMLWIRPACSGWLLVLPQAHWCFSISVSYTRPAAGQRSTVRSRPGRPPTPAAVPGRLWGHHFPAGDRARTIHSDPSPGQTRSHRQSSDEAERGPVASLPELPVGPSAGGARPHHG